MRLAENGNIQEKYVELYIVAMESVIAMLINIATTLTIGWMLGMWWYSIVLFAAFIPLRSYAGGYHARGYISCYFESCTLLAAMLLLMKYIIQREKPISALWLVFVVAVTVIFLLAPLADENKPISEKERIVFKRRTRVLLTLEIIITVLLAALHIDYGYAVMMAVILSALLLLLHKIRERVILNRKK